MLLSTAVNANVFGYFGHTNSNYLASRLAPNESEFFGGAHEINRVINDVRVVLNNLKSFMRFTNRREPRQPANKPTI